MRYVCLTASTLVLGGVLASHAASPAEDPSAALTSIPARTWAVECADKEVLIIQHPDSYLRYRLHEVDDKGDRIRDQIETPSGSVSRLIVRDGHPLSPADDAEERARLTDLLNSPSTFARHIHSDQANKKLGIDLLHQMPDAMLWTYTPGQPQLPPELVPKDSSGPLVVLDFEPNPKWTPPSLPAESLTGLRGRVWIDPRTHSMVRFEGDIFHAVNVGWGVLAHIYPGGKFQLNQTETGNQRWIILHVDEQLNVRALLLKTLHQRLIFDTSDFQTIPPMSYQDAIKLLLATPLPAR